jgi:hypothetical protein
VKFIKLLTKLIKIPFIGKWFIGTLSYKIYFNYEFKRTLIECCELISHELHEMLETLDYRKEINALIEEINQNVTELILLQESLTHQIPQMIDFINTKRASYHILRFQKKQIDHFESLGMVTEKDRDDWIKKIYARLNGLDNLAPDMDTFKTQVAHVSHFLLDYPVFSSLTPEQLRAFKDKGKLDVYLKNGKFSLVELF